MMNPTPTYMAFLAESLVAALNPQLAGLDRSADGFENRGGNRSLGWGAGGDGKPPPVGHSPDRRRCANLSALAMALSAHFPGVMQTGIASIGAEPVFLMEGTRSFDKSAGLLGLGRRALRRIPVNEQLELDVQQLEAAIKEMESGKKPFCVVATHQEPPAQARSTTYRRFTNLPALR